MTYDGVLDLIERAKLSVPSCFQLPQSDPCRRRRRAYSSRGRWCQRHFITDIPVARTRAGGVGWQ